MLSHLMRTQITFQTTNQQILDVTSILEDLTQLLKAGKLTSSVTMPVVGDSFFDAFMAISVGFAVLEVLNMSSAIYIQRRIRYFRRLNTADAHLEIERLKNHIGLCGFIRPPGMLFFLKDVSKAIYERLTGVLGVVIIALWPAWTFIQMKLSRKKGEVDVELGSRGDVDDRMARQSRQLRVEDT